MISTPPLLDPERPALNDISGVGIFACIEQHIAAGEIALLGADRQHAQRRRPQQAQCRDALEQGNIILDRHENQLRQYESLRESYHGTSL